jgi:hypothetical protein
MKIEFVIFAPDPLVLRAVKAVLMQQPMCVRNIITLDFVRADDAKAFVESRGADPMMGMVNAKDGRAISEDLRRAFPGVEAETKSLCAALSVPVEEDGYTPRGFTLCVPSGVQKCPNVFVYGTSDAEDRICDAFSTVAKLVTVDCSIAVPCMGNLIGGRTTLRSSIRSMVFALESMPLM